jgi:glycosyltransferase involved in cell wall biosynthesis
MEIIVADNDSQDGTPEFALTSGCKVIKGGSPAVGRNKGAEAAVGELFLFLDADTVLWDNCLKSCLSEFNERKLDAATFLFRLDGNRSIDKIMFSLGNMILLISQYIDPHSAGGLILCRRWIFDKLAGFREELKQAEDHDFVKRASQIGRFRVLHKSLSWSPRRLEREGRLKVVGKYIKSEVYRKLKGEISVDLFDYKYGDY